MTFTFFSAWKEAYDMRHEPEAVRTLGELSWKMIVGVGIVGVAVCISYGAWLYLIPPEESTGSVVTTSVQSFNREELAKIVTVLETRASAFREKVAR